MLFGVGYLSKGTFSIISKNLAEPSDAPLLMHIINIIHTVISILTNAIWPIFSAAISFYAKHDIPTIMYMHIVMYTLHFKLWFDTSMCP